MITNQSPILALTSSSPAVETDTSPTEPNPGLEVLPPAKAKEQAFLRKEFEAELDRPVRECLFQYHYATKNVSNNAIGTTERLYVVLRWPAIHSIAEPLSPQKPGRRGAKYPAGLLLALVCWALEVGSRDEVESRLRDKFFWLNVRTIWLEETGQLLPTTPPGASHIDSFYSRTRANSKDGQGLEMGIEVFRSESLALVRSLDGLDPAAPFDSSIGSWANTVYGDGTYVRPNSEVKKVATGVDDDGDVEFAYVGSRSKRSSKKAQGPRVQKVRTAAHEDGKETSATGTCFVSIGWRGPLVRERIILDIQASIGSEAATALPMLKRLAAATQGGLHTIVWDMIIANRLNEFTAATGAVLITKKPGAPGKIEHRPTLKDLKTQFRIPYSKWSRKMSKTDTWKKLTAVDRKRAETHFLYGLWQEYAHSLKKTAGVSVQNRTNSLQIRRSDITHLTSVRCRKDIDGCEHLLAWEDGTLVEVMDLGNKPLRLQTGKRKKAERTPEADGSWSITGTWILTCGDFQWEEFAHWNNSASTKDHESGNGLQGWNGDVVSELDGQLFLKQYGERNDSEAYHQWLKKRFKFNRANTLNFHDQLLDFLALAITNNATAYALNAGTIKGVDNGPRQLVRSHQNAA